MPEFNFAITISAFIAGVLTFLAPCTLPMVPGYLGFISGVSLEDLKNPAKEKNTRIKIFLNGLFFIAGFSAMFIIFGTLAGFFGGALAQYRLWLARIGGAFIIIFGFFMLNVIKIPFLQAERQIRVPPIFKRGNPLNSFILGSAFGVGWTPCVGPILGSVLLLASVSATAFQGAVLLTIFSMGLAVPFLLIATGIGSASNYLFRYSRYLNATSVIGGIFLISLGVLVIMNRTGLLLAYGYQLFKFINYDRLLDYL